MSEFDDKLNALLSNPDSMAQIMQLAQSLSGQSGQPSSVNAPVPSGGGPWAQPPNDAQSPNLPHQPPPVAGGPSPFAAGGPSGGQQPSPLGGLDMLSSLAGGLDPKLIARLLPLVQDLTSGNDSNARALLFALRPYLKEERQDRVERALQLAKLLHMGKKFFKSWEG